MARRNYRELPNQYARKRNEYRTEETARAGVFRIKNVSEDQLGTYYRRKLISNTQLDAGRKFSKSCRHPKVVGAYSQTIQGEPENAAETLTDHYLACKSLGPLSNIVIEVCVMNHSAGHMHPKGIDLLRFALDHLIKHYGLRGPESERRINQQL